MNDFYVSFQIELFRYAKKGFVPTFCKSGVRLNGGSATVETYHHVSPFSVGPHVHVPAMSVTEQDLHDGLTQGGWHSPAAVWYACVSEQGYEVSAGSSCVLMGHRAHNGTPYSLERAQDFHDEPSLRFIQNFQIFAHKAE